MIDHFLIFSKTGQVLFVQNNFKLKGDPVDKLIRTVLLEDRTGEKKFITNVLARACKPVFVPQSPLCWQDYTLKWTMANDLNLVFVAVYQSILKILYIEELLKLVKQAYVDFAACIRMQMV